MNNNEETVEIDLLEILFLIKKRIWIIIASALIFGSVTGIFTYYFVEDLYSSTSKLYILSSSTAITSLTDIQIGTSLTKDYIQLVQGRPMVEEVIDNLNLNRTYEEVLDQMTFSNPTDTRILVITAKDPDPVLAKDIVDEFAKVARTNIADIMQIKEPSITEWGYISDKPVSPNIVKNILIGALLGIFLSVVVVVLLYMLDDTVKSSDDIEKYLKLNTLTSIPLLEDEDKSSKGGLKDSFKKRKSKSSGKRKESSKK